MSASLRTGQPIPGDKHWMTLQEAAVYISTSVKTVRRRVASGELPAYVCGKRGLRVLREDLDNLMRPV